MSAYTATATVTGTPVVRANPRGGGPDLRDPDVVDVARKGLQTHARDTVRVGVTQSDGARAVAYLTREDAEALATAVLTAADLDADHPQPPPRLAGGLGPSHPIGPRAADYALNAVEAAIREALAAGCLRSEVLGRIANGLTGRTSGPVERRLARQFGDALDAEEANP